jgi:hypothetical protein
MKRALGLLLLALGCDATPEPPGGKPSGPWVGLKAALEHPGAVDAWTIRGDLREGYLKYPESSRRATVDASDVEKLTSILSDPKTYSDLAPGCIPNPGVKIRFTRTNLEPIWLVFCFECEELFVYEGSAGRETKELDHLAAKALVVVMKRIFPKEASIQNLR